MKQTFVLLLTLLFPTLLFSQEVEKGITGRVIGSCLSFMLAFYILWRKQAD